MSNAKRSPRKNGTKGLVLDESTNPPLKPPSLSPATALTVNPSGLRVQASLDHVADSLGGRETFLDACAQSDSEKARNFLAYYRSLPSDTAISLQDVCVRANLDPTDLVGSMMGKLIMQSNNVALLKSALARPSIMDASIQIALGDDELAFQAQKLQFQIGGFIKGEGTQVVNLTQNVQGTGILSFEDDSQQSTASVKAEGKPVVAPSTEPVSYDADGELAPSVPS